MTLETHKPVLSLFLLVADPEPGTATSPAYLLAASLPRDRFRVTVGVLGTAAGPRFDELRTAGITVLSLPIRNMFDLSGAHRLRQAAKEADPAVVHAWGPIAARTARLIVSRDGNINSPRLVVSGAATLVGSSSGWLLARQLRRADRVIPAIRPEGERYRQLGVPSERLTLIGPAAPTIAPQVNRDALCKKLNIPTESLLLVAGGQTVRGTGPKDAIVAFDMLRYDSPKLHLIVCGSGTEAISLERFGRALAFDDFRVRFAMSASERTTAVASAYAVFITRVGAGVEEALEAMAAGKPVVGWQTPELTEIVDDGITGFLVPFGDRTALAARMRKLLDEPDCALEMGKAGRARIAGRFSEVRMIEQYARLYRELASNA